MTDLPLALHVNSFQGEAGEGKGAVGNRVNVKGEYVTGTERANSCHQCSEERRVGDNIEKYSLDFSMGYLFG